VLLSTDIRRRFPSTWETVFVAVVAAITLMLVVMANNSTKTPADPIIRNIYPSLSGGMTWQADWDTETSNGWASDPWVRIGSPNDVSYHNEDGVLYVSGETSRFYVRDPEQKRQWGNIEVTVYAKRVKDDGVPYSGIVTSVRTNHGMSADIEDAPCDSRGLSARLRFDGSADFGKETNHPTTIPTDDLQLFTDGLPYDQWIGYKHIVYDIDAGTGTHQELWMDLTGGKDGGDWQLVATHEDHYGDGFGEEACAKGIDPTLPLVQGYRPGSESGLPNLSVLLRADGIGEDGLQYRGLSVREIIAP